jgi:diguanylate cyclase (GGDEF)-like protein
MRSLSNAHERLSLSDPLTSTANSRMFMTSLGQEIERLRRFGRPFTVAYLDVDSFKSVNDTLGHAAGDEVLRGIADCLNSVAREVDTVARLGGDEFAILMPETGEQAASAALERVADDLDDFLRRAAPAVQNIGVTIGAAVYTKKPPSADDAIRFADELMYGGKQAGKGLVLRVHE